MTQIIEKNYKHKAAGFDIYTEIYVLTEEGKTKAINIE